VKKYYFKITAILSVFILQVPIFVFAADEESKKIDETTFENLPAFLEHIKDYLLAFIGALAILFIIIGGVQYITAGGNEDTAKKAKLTITYAVMGLAFIIMVQVILSLLNSSLFEIFGTGTHDV